MQETLGNFASSAADLEMGLFLGRTGRQSSTPEPAQSLERTIHNAGSYLMHVAARLNSMQERLTEAKDAFLARRAAVGTPSLLIVGGGLFWTVRRKAGCCTFLWAEEFHATVTMRK